MHDPALLGNLRLTVIKSEKKRTPKSEVDTVIMTTTYGFYNEFSSNIPILIKNRKLNFVRFLH